MGGAGLGPRGRLTADSAASVAGGAGCRAGSQVVGRWNAGLASSPSSPCAVRSAHFPSSAPLRGPPWACSVPPCSCTKPSTDASPAPRVGGASRTGAPESCTSPSAASRSLSCVTRSARWPAAWSAPVAAPSRRGNVYRTMAATATLRRVTPPKIDRTMRCVAVGFPGVWSRARHQSKILACGGTLPRYGTCADRAVPRVPPSSRQFPEAGRTARADTRLPAAPSGADAAARDRLRARKKPHTTTYPAIRPLRRRCSERPGALRPLGARGCVGRVRATGDEIAGTRAFVSGLVEPGVEGLQQMRS
jgi:hypothetical protein